MCLSVLAAAEVLGNSCYLREGKKLYLKCTDEKGGESVPKIFTAFSFLFAATVFFARLFMSNCFAVFLYLRAKRNPSRHFINILTISGPNLGNNCAAKTHKFVSLKTEKGGRSAESAGSEDFSSPPSKLL